MAELWRGLCAKVVGLLAKLIKSELLLLESSIKNPKYKDSNLIR